MNQEKGITLASLVIYVIMFTLILGLLAGFSSYIYGNLNNVSSDSYSAEEFNKFNINFIKDVKSSTNANITSSGNNVQIVLENGVNYNYIAEEKAIYRNKVKIAEKISTFEASINDVEKNVVKKVITIKIGTGKNETDFGKTIKYVLKYW